MTRFQVSMHLRVSHERFCCNDAPLPSTGSTRAVFPSVSGTIRALRLPAQNTKSLMDSLPQSTRSLLLSCSPQRSRKVGGPLQARAWGAGRPTFRLPSCRREWDLSGLQAILPVPLLRSSTPAEPMSPCHIGYIDAAPATHTTKASTRADFGAHSRSFGTR